MRGNIAIVTKYKISDQHLKIPSQDILNLVLNSLETDKAIEPKTIDLRGKTSIADIMIVVTGSSRRHVVAMAEHIIEKLKPKGIAVRAEGLTACDWVLLDCNEIIVHLFCSESRNFYNLEKMWSFHIESESSPDTQRDI